MAAKFLLKLSALFTMVFALFWASLVSADTSSKQTALPQCAIQSGPPLFQPDTRLPFYLARQAGNHAVQYCNKESLLADQPWVTSTDIQPLKKNQSYSVVSFVMDKDGQWADFRECPVTITGKKWVIAARNSCRAMNDAEGRRYIASFR